MVMEQTVVYESIDDGKATRVTDRMTAKMPLPRWLAKRLFSFMMYKMNHYGEMYDTAVKLVTEESGHSEHN